MAHYVKLNPKSSIFFDQSSKIKVVRNEVVALTDSQFNLRAIKSALSSGYLIEVSEKEVKGKAMPASPEPTAPEGASREAEKEAKSSVDELMAKFRELMEEDSDVAKIKGNFNLEELKALAESLDIQPEDGDTKADLVEAIVDELTSAE